MTHDLVQQWYYGLNLLRNERVKHVSQDTGKNLKKWKLIRYVNNELSYVSSWCSCRWVWSSLTRAIRNTTCALIYCWKSPKMSGFLTQGSCWLSISLPRCCQAVILHPCWKLDPHLRNSHQQHGTQDSLCAGHYRNTASVNTGITSRAFTSQGYPAWWCDASIYIFKQPSQGVTALCGAPAVRIVVARIQCTV